MATSLAFAGHTGPVTACCSVGITVDGKPVRAIISGSYDGVIRVFDEAGTALRTLATLKSPAGDPT